MPPEILAIAVPGTEELTETGLGVAGAAATGVVEGIIVRLAPQLGALETPFTWATLLGVPALGVAGALLMKGMLGEVFKGVAYAGTGYAASVIPAMVIPEGLLGKKRGPGNTGEDVKRLGMGDALRAPQNAQRAAAKVGIDF